MTRQSNKDEIRKARAFLQKRGFKTRDISPRTFATTARKTNKTFTELLKRIAEHMMRGQGVTQSPVATKLAGGDVT